MTGRSKLVSVGGALHREVQHFHPLGAVVVLGSACAIGVVSYLAIGTRPIPGGLAVVIVLLLGLLVLTIFRLTTEVNDDRIQVSFGWLGLVRFTIPLGSVRGVRTVEYSPLREFGGWGIRFGRKGRRAYSARGNRAVEIHTETRDILIGSADPEALQASIERALNCGRRS